MRFVLVTTPIRPIPTDYPPVGSTSLMETLIARGYSPFFYDIDALRPSFDEVVEFFRKNQPDILGISAVVSTAYRYTKMLSEAVKRVSPHTKIILGGNLAASAEILLRKCPIDICVIGEGENVLLELVQYWEKFGDLSPRTELSAIKGISFLNNSGEMEFTGYAPQIESAKLRQPNFELLEKYSDITRFIKSPFELQHFVEDERSYEPHRKDKKMASILSAKGCVARCTFCHRWDKGYRVHPAEQIANTIRYLKDKYNVGFIRFSDENFGSDPRQVEALINAIKPLDVLFDVTGIRVHTVDRNPLLIPQLKSAGCVAMYFGMETGSPKMLGVMEKNASLVQNLNVMDKLIEHNMYTIVQLVVGMPGENEQTIQETIEFVKKATERLPEPPFYRLSANYFQALPGTSGYEFMRSKGLIGSTLDDEENYLLKISDVDASSFEHYQNVSECSTPQTRTWVSRIVREASIHYFRKRNWKPVARTSRTRVIKDYIRGGYFRTFKTNYRFHPNFLRMWDTFRFIFDGLNILRHRIHVEGWVSIVLTTIRLKAHENRQPFLISGPISLRKIVKFPEISSIGKSEASMIPLRMGR